MGRIDNLDQSQMDKLVRRIEKLERQNPIGFSSITRGALRVASPEGLVVEGSAKVSGTLTVTGPDGELIGTGTIDWTGPANLNGDTKISGKLDVSGITTLLNNLIVGAGGKITIEGGDPLMLGLIAGLPALGFTAGTIAGTPGGLRIDGGTATVQVSGSAVAISIGGSAKATISGSGLGVTGDVSASGNLSVGGASTLTGAITNTNMPTTPAAGKTANVWQDPSTKKLYRMI